MGSIFRKFTYCLRDICTCLLQVFTYERFTFAYDLNHNLNITLQKPAASLTAFECQDLFSTINNVDVFMKKSHKQADVWRRFTYI